MRAETAVQMKKLGEDYWGAIRCLAGASFFREA
jgi:hypothetical protein